MIDKRKEKEIEAKLDEAEAKNKNDNSTADAQDIYSKSEGKDPETGVEIPTEESVEEAKEWVDNENQR